MAIPPGNPLPHDDDLTMDFCFNGSTGISRILRSIGLYHDRTSNGILRESSSFEKALAECRSVGTESTLEELMKILAEGYPSRFGWPEKLPCFSRLLECLFRRKKNRSGLLHKSSNGNGFRVPRSTFAAGNSADSFTALHLMKWG